MKEHESLGNEGKDNQDALLIAPCGMNCGICLGYLRKKNRCSGCRSGSIANPAYCRTCIIINCELLKNRASGFCNDCEKFPCRRLKQLDKRYRLRYKMSMLDNLDIIKNNGIARFIEEEKAKWQCLQCGATLCVHRNFCLHCKQPALREGLSSEKQLNN